ncbi:MAG TPA: sugar phosphate isomerase/epimerase family protein [Methylomirabilota bacterium]|nr:sugar phosphate isomerase/epimerase family protein [Methylomirabilota bacterium]
MRLSISNLAWEPSDDADVAALLTSRGVDAIDVAPGKYFPDPPRTTDAAIAGVRAAWARRGIAITGMQALLFGTTGLNVFGEAAVQARMLEHLSAVCRIARGLGARHLVFGSPRNRDRAGLDDAQVEQRAASFFRRLGDIAADHDVEICLEPNPPAYGANYMTTAAESAAVVRMVAHPAVRLQFDTGALAVSGEDAGTIVAAHAALIGHVHASEPALAPLGEGGVVDHVSAGRAIRQHRPDLTVAIEMLVPAPADRLAVIAHAIDCARAAYGGDPAVGDHGPRHARSG